MKKKLSMLSKEIEKRILEKSELDYYTGSELKNIRLNRSMSLNSASFSICSTSYLSKLENNKLIPNKDVVCKLCEVYKVPEDKINAILNLKDLLEEAVVCFFKDDSEGLKKIMNSVMELTSVRYVLISFIYYIYTLDLYNAERAYKKLLELASSLNDTDLEYFTLFSAIYNYYSGDYLEALDNIKMLEGCRNELVILGYKIYYFYINYAMCNMDTIEAYNDLYETYLRNGKYDEINKISYYMAIYYLKVNCISGYNDMFKSSASFFRHL